MKKALFVIFFLLMCCNSDSKQPHYTITLFTNSKMAVIKTNGILVLSVKELEKIIK